MRILGFARQKNGKFIVCLTTPPSLLLFSFIYVPLLCVANSKYLMLPIIFFHSFVILTDVNGAMLTAGRKQNGCYSQNILWIFPIT